MLLASELSLGLSVAYKSLLDKLTGWQGKVQGINFPKE